MREKSIKLGVAFLALGYFAYTTQIEMCLAILLLYLINYTSLRVLFKVNSKSIFFFDLFFVIYGALTLFTHMHLILNPLDDFFVHNDSAWSFYYNTINRGLPLKWNELTSEILFSIAYADYAIPSYIFTIIAKLGVMFGIINLRLLLRAHIFSFIAMIPALMANLLKRYNLNSKVYEQSIIVFCLCTYLYITSAIFTRDSYVAFSYFLAAYVVLLPQCRMRLFKFALIFVLALGSRPENGLLVLVYFGGYYIAKAENKNSSLLFVILIGVCVALFFALGSLVETALDTVARYNDRAAEENTGGVFSRLYSLPFPLNLFIMVIYMLIMPLPIDYYITYDGGSILTLPFVLSPYLMSLLFISVLWFIFKKFKVNTNVSILILMSIVAFCAITQGSPDLRRAYAPIPGLYLAYLLIREHIPKSINQFCRVIIWPMILLINVVFFIYLH